VRQVGIKLKWKSFEVSQTTVSLNDLTDDRETLWNAFQGLLLPHASSFADFRLLGCRFIELHDKEAAAAVVATSAQGSSGPHTKQLRLEDMLANRVQQKKRRQPAPFSEVVDVSDDDDSIEDLPGRSDDDVAVLEPMLQPASTPSKQSNREVMCIESDDDQEQQRARPNYRQPRHRH
jgi:hypothetical protein